MLQKWCDYLRDESWTFDNARLDNADEPVLPSLEGNFSICVVCFMIVITVNPSGYFIVF